MLLFATNQIKLTKRVGIFYYLFNGTLCEFSVPIFPLYWITVVLHNYLIDDHPFEISPVPDRPGQPYRLTQSALILAILKCLCSQTPRTVVSTLEAFD